MIRFELQVPNPERAIDFYTRTFGWTFTKFTGPQDYWFIQTGSPDSPGIDGGLLQSPDGATRTTNTIEVPSIDEYLANVQAHGGQVVVPKMTMPGMGYLAYCTDPEGTIFGVSQTDAGAKRVKYAVKK